MILAHAATVQHPTNGAWLAFLALWVFLSAGLILAGISIYRDRARFAALRKPKAGEVWVEINPAWTRAGRVLVLELSRNGKQLWHCGASDNFETPAEREKWQREHPDVKPVVFRLRQPSALDDVREFVAQYRFERIIEPAFP